MVKVIAGGTFAASSKRRSTAPKNWGSRTSTAFTRSARRWKIAPHDIVDDLARNYQQARLSFEPYWENQTPTFGPQGVRIFERQLAKPGAGS